jgi:ribosomal protein S17
MIKMGKKYTGCMLERAIRKYRKIAVLRRFSHAKLCRIIENHKKYNIEMFSLCVMQ